MLVSYTEYDAAISAPPENPSEAFAKSESTIDTEGLTFTPINIFPSTFRLLWHEGLDDRFLNPELLSYAPPELPFISPLHVTDPDVSTRKAGISSTLTHIIG